MKLIRFLLIFLLTLAFAILLDNRLGQLPPLGRFLSPFQGFYQNGENEEEALSLPEEGLEGLQNPVKVVFDEFQIPHIEAESDSDAYFIQGFLTARFRLWQMEIQTYAAAGRLSEILGKDFLAYDREIRRQGIGFGAANALARMETDTLSQLALEAYSAGVNAYINSLTDASLPIEYKLLDYRPEAWSPLKSALLLKYMAKDLTGRDDDLENTNLRKALGPELFKRLYPDRLPNEDPIIPTGTPFKFKPLQLKKPLGEIVSTNPVAGRTLPDADPDNGSNNWAVSSRKTKSGHAILANDPHLGLNLPSLWFALQISTPQQNVFGVSLPGAPGIIIGFNDSIAWGVTNAQRDVRDWYRIEFQDSSQQKYRYEKQWLETQVRAEQIKIRRPYVWQDELSYIDSVTYTHFGPVVFDRGFGNSPQQTGYALRWTAHDPSNELRSFLLLNRAKNYTDFRDAIRTYQTPAQNFVFASVNDTIALWVQGAFPARWEEQGKFLMDGIDARFEWQGFIPPEQNASIVNPARGFVSSANQIPAAPDYPYYIYDSYYEHYRNRRINQQLSRMRNISVEDMMQLQLDNYNMRAAETLPRMLNMLPQDTLQGEALTVFNKLTRWDFQNQANSEAAALYERWWQLLNNYWWDEIDSLQEPGDRPNPPVIAYLLANDTLPPLTDVQQTPQKEDLRTLLTLSFQDLIRWQKNWVEEHGSPLRWGKFKDSKIEHMLKLEAFGMYDMEVDGGASIVNANKGNHGPSWRMVVEMSRPVKAWGIYPGGQSGNPGSPYYLNRIESWRNGQYHRLYFRTAETPFDDKMIKTFVLTP